MNNVDFGKFDALEKIGGGLLGVVAIGAAVAELVLGEVNAESIAGMIKDIAGTLIVVMVLLAALKKLVPKKTTDFKSIFDSEMEKIVTKYSPLIGKDTDKEGRYNIADNMDVIYNNSSSNYHWLFDFNYKNELTFVVSKTLFMGKSKEDFSEMQKRIVESITAKITRDFELIKNEWKQTDKGFKLYFNHDLTTAEEAMAVTEIIDKIILLYIVEYKK